MSSICFCIVNRNKLRGAIFQKRKQWVVFVVSFFLLNTVTFSKVKTRVHFRCNNCTFSTEPFKIYDFAYISIAFIFTIYRVRHSKLFFWNLLSQIEICKLNSFWRWFWNPEIWEILLVQTVFMKHILCAIYNPICKYLLVLSEFWIFTNFRGLFQAITSNKPWIR